LQEGIDKGWMTMEPRKKEENSAAKALAVAVDGADVPKVFEEK
jgi:hypothetical protein